MASMRELNPFHHLRHGRRLTALAVSVGLASGAGFTGSTIGFDGSIGGRSGAITLGDGEAHRQATGRETTTLGINNVGLNVSGENNDSTARLGILFNHRKDGSSYDVKIEKKDQADGRSPISVAFPKSQELGYRPQK